MTVVWRNEPGTDAAGSNNDSRRWTAVRREPMIEAKVDAGRLGRGRIDQLAIETGARYRVDGPLSVRAVRLVRESAGGVVEDAATHRECLGEDGFREPRSFESVDATDGQGQVDGASCVEVGSSRVRAALIEGDLVSAPGKEDGEKGAGQPGADDRDP